MKINISFLFIIIISLFNLSFCWYSKCDTHGRCVLLETENSPNEYYLEPGFMPLFPDDEVIPIKDENSNESNTFSLEVYTGYSKYGEFENSENNYECGNGLSECINSCCKEGFCVGTIHECNTKRDNKKIIYIVTSSVFFAFIIGYWVIFFCLACNYNKKQDFEEFKEKQDYGTKKFDENVQNNNKNEDDSERNDEIQSNEVSMENQNNINNNINNEENKEIEEEDKKRSKIDKVAKNITNIGKEYKIKEEDQSSAEAKKKKEDSNNLIESANENIEDKKEESKTENVKNIDISGSFKEENLE
jgi:hypothetical protein